MDDQNRYEEVPQKENKFVKAMKSFGKYLQLLWIGFIDSFKYNNMKLATILLVIPGLLIGCFLNYHAPIIQQVSYSTTYFDEENFEIVKITFPGMKFDYTGIAIFALMLVGILNIFFALNVNSKKNLGSVISVTIMTVIMLALTAAYFYAVFYYKHLVEEGESINGEVQKITSTTYESDFLPNYMKSVISIAISDACSVAGCVLGFIHYDRTYEKVDR